MNDLELVKEMRRTTPAMTAEAERATRGRLREAMAADGLRTRRWSARRPVPRWPALAGAFALATAMAVLAAGITGARDGDGGRERGPGPASVVPAVPVASVQDLGDRAASAAERTNYLQPRPDQWVYSRYLFEVAFEKPHELKPNEQWIRVDGRQLAFRGPDGHLAVLPPRRPSGNAQFSPADYHKLPTEPGQLLRFLYARAPHVEQLQGRHNRHRDIFVAANTMLENPLPPKLRAALFRALPKINGVALRRSAVDLSGRRGVAFSFAISEWERYLIILDTATYGYLGMRSELRFHRGPRGGKPIPALRSTAQLGTGIVDKPGQVPAPQQ